MLAKYWIQIPPYLNPDLHIHAARFKRDVIQIGHSARFQRVRFMVTWITLQFNVEFSPLLNLRFGFPVQRIGEFPQESSQYAEIRDTGWNVWSSGRHSCVHCMRSPFRWFAMLEIHLFIALVIHHVDLTALDTVPANVRNLFRFTIFFLKWCIVLAE